MKYGAEPADLGIIDLSPTEMMFWLYCPVKKPYGQIYLPFTLEQYKPIVESVLKDCYVGNKYIYITAKTLWVEGKYVGNRPGWHSDGFGTDDLNYIWYDRNPTEFLIGDFELSTDCTESMDQMYEYSLDAANEQFKTYPEKHLLRLDQRVIHKCPHIYAPGMRTFVKISISGDPYDLEGNSINPHFGEIFDKKARLTSRNHPSSKYS